MKYNQIPTEDSESRLESVLTGQEFEPEAGRELQLEAAKRRVLALVGLTGCIAVLSDLETDSCYIFSGSFGETLGLGAYSEDRNSAFEHGIFDNIPAFRPTSFWNVTLRTSGSSISSSQSLSEKRRISRP